MTLRARPALGRAFAALDGAQVTWCVLRADSGAGSPDEVDVLVAKEDLHRVGTVLAGADFVPACRGSEQHGYVAYDAPTDCFVRIDVTWSVVVGRSRRSPLPWGRSSRADVAAVLLRRRQRTDALWRLRPDDDFWALLLHDSGAEGGPDAQQARHLRGLAGGARPDGLLGALVSAHCPPAWDAARILAAVRHGGPPELAAVGALLRGRVTTADRVVAAGRRVFDLLSGVRCPRGLSVAILGPDGAGKSTLAEGITATFELPARTVYHGLWQGEDTREYPAAALLAAARRPFRSWRKGAATRVHQLLGRLVVLDRHPYDALLPPSTPYPLAKRIFFTFLARTVPAPSLVLVLDVSAEVTAARRPGEDATTLRAARVEYLELARRLPSGVRVEVLDADREPAAVRAAATAAIWRARLGRRPT